MLRIGRIPYLNCEPFFARLGGVELVALNPRRLGEAVAAGDLDAGPLSLVDQLRLEAHLEPLPFGIATDHARFFATSGRSPSLSRRGLEE